MRQTLNVSDTLVALFNEKMRILFIFCLSSNLTTFTIALNYYHATANCRVHFASFFSLFLEWMGAVGLKS